MLEKILRRVSNATKSFANVVELSNPNHRKIIREYHKVDFQKYDQAVLQPLEKKYRSLKHLANTIRKNKDPAALIQKVYAINAVTQLGQGVMDALEINMQDIANKDADEKEKTEMKTIIDEIKEYYNLLKNISQDRKEFYERVVKTTVEIQDHNKFELNIIFENQGFYNHIAASGFQSASCARSMYDNEMELTEAWINKVRKNEKHMKTIKQKHSDLFKLLDDDSFESKKMPTKKAFEAFKTESIKYQNSQIDMIYSK